MATKQILNSSESVEWYTPAPYVEAAREVLGGIELDPASCSEAQETVKAERYYSANGLALPWVARSVFLNPPYGTTNGKSNQLLWSTKLIEAYRHAGFLTIGPDAEYFHEVAGSSAGAVHRAILLVNACTSERWFRPLWQFPICFTDHRIKFDYPKVRRYPAMDLVAAGVRSVSIRRLLFNKPLRVWSWANQGWWSAKEGAWLKDPGDVTYYFLQSKSRRSAAGLVSDFGLPEDIAFDRADAPAQPTKGSAFIYFGSDPLVFAYKFKQFGPVVQAMKIHAGPRRHANVPTEVRAIA